MNTPLWCVAAAIGVLVGMATYIVLKKRKRLHDFLKEADRQMRRRDD